MAAPSILHQVVIVGGGSAGISVASRLRKAGVTDIGVIEPSDTHYYQPLWTLVGGGRASLEETARPQATVMPAGVAWIKAAAEAVDPDRRTVTLHAGATVTYDYLVVAPGIQLDWHKVPGLETALETPYVSSNYRYELAPKTWDRIRQMRSGTAVFTMPGGLIKCAGAPQKIAYLAADHWRREGVLDQIDVHLVLPTPGMFGVKVFADEFRLDYDFMHVVPPQSAPDWVKATPLANPEDPAGYIEVDQHTMQHTRYPNVYALGDAGSTPNSKTGAAIRKQAPVVAENLLRTMAGQEPGASYGGYASCPITTARDKMLLAEFDYTMTHTPSFPVIDTTRERKDMWLLKRYGLPQLYWNLMLPGRA